jgi:hypothetical protein
MGNLSDLLKARRVEVNEEVYEEKANEHRGYDTIEYNEDGSMKEWAAHDRALHTPKPYLMKPELTECGFDTGDWQTWFDCFDEDQDFIIFGAGASTLSQPLEKLDGKVVYGINWTLKWFNPTFLQIIDDQPYMTQVRENPNWGASAKDTQLITSIQCKKKQMGNYGQEVPDFRIRQSSNPQKAGEFAFAENPREIITWYANSLGYALNVAYWFKPKRIIIMGMDFGGAHFFGDGRAAGAHCHYGMEGTMKQRLRSDLEQLYAELIERGVEVIQVGESKLDIFPKVASLDEIM